MIYDFLRETVICHRGFGRGDITTIIDQLPLWLCSGVRETERTKREPLSHWGLPDTRAVDSYVMNHEIILSIYPPIISTILALSVSG